MFMYVPYTEAAFFFFSSVMLLGLKQNNQWMILTGLFFASLTRPTAVFFIPAIICMEMFSYENIRKFLKNVLLYSSVPLLGILVVVLFQHKATGIWFAYFKAQTLFWKRTIQLPDLPFTTWDGPRMLWLDGLALFFGIMALAILILFLVKKLRKPEAVEKNRALYFSLCYLMMALFSVVFLNGKDVNGGTSLMGANRYIMATPYFIILLLFLSSDVKLKFEYLMIYIAAAVATFFLLRVEGGGFINYDSYDKFYYRFLIVLNGLIFILISKYFKSRFISMVYLINVFAQVIIMHQFAIGRWIG